MPAPAGYRLYGNDPGAFAAQIATNATVGQPVYSAPGAIFQIFGTADGIRVTDLRTISGDPSDVVIADGQGFPPFYAPAGSGALQYAAVVGGVVSSVRTDAYPSDLADRVKAVETGVPTGVDLTGYATLSAAQNYASSARQDAINSAQNYTDSAVVALEAPGANPLTQYVLTMTRPGQTPKQTRLWVEAVFPSAADGAADGDLLAYTA